MTVTAKPDAREFEAQMSDPSRLTEMNQNGKIGEFVKDYADARIAELGADISRKVKDETDRSVAEFLKDTGGVKRVPQATEGNRKRDLKSLAKGKGAMYNSHAPGATIDKERLTCNAAPTAG